MTIDELCELNADEWDKLTEQQLLDIFKPFFNVTRPELARQQTKTKTTSNFKAPVIVMDEKKQKALAMLAASGMDMGFMSRMRRVKK